MTTTGSAAQAGAIGVGAPSNAERMWLQADTRSQPATTEHGLLTTTYSGIALSNPLRRNSHRKLGKQNRRY